MTRERERKSTQKQASDSGIVLGLTLPFFNHVGVLLSVLLYFLSSCRRSLCISMNAVINDALNLFQIGVVLRFVVEIFQGHAVHLLCSSEPRTPHNQSRDAIRNEHVQAQEYCC